MAKYIMLLKWTDQGIRNIKESPARLDAAREHAKEIGCTLSDFYLTIGAYDAMATLEAPDDETAARFLLSAASTGAIRSTTMKAFPEDVYRKIMGSL